MKSLQTIINKETKNIISKIFFEGYRGFSLKVLSKLPTVREMERYANKHLTKLGTGSSRVVFALGAGKVLKIDLGAGFGGGQNKSEMKSYTSPTIPQEYLAKIYSADQKYRWIVSEAVQVFADNSQVKNKINIPKNFFGMFSRVFLAKPKYSFEKALSVAEKLYKDTVGGSEFYKNLSKIDFQLLKAYFSLTKAGIDDLDRFDHWGITSSGRVVAADYGIEQRRLWQNNDYE